MSFSPVIGTDVPEAANGVAMPVPSENGPHTHALASSPQFLKCGGRVPSLDGSLGETENGAADGEGEGHTDTPHNSVSPSDTQHTHTLHTDTAHPSLPAATHTADTDTPPKDMPLTRESPQTVEAQDEAPSRDSPHTGTPSKDISPPPPGDTLSADPQQTETETDTETGHTESASCCTAESAGGREEKEEEEEDNDEKQDAEEDKKEESDARHEEKTETGETVELTEEPSAEAGPSSGATPPRPTGAVSDSSPCPPHVMAQVRVRNVPERERIVRGMQDSKSLDEISQACGGGARGGGRGGQPEGRRATISSALELEGTVSHDGDLTHFICRNLEQKIKMSSKPSLDCDCDSDCSGPIHRVRGSSRRPADIPPIDPAVLVDLQKHTQDVAHSVEMMMRSLNGTIQNMTALSVGYIQTYRDSVDSLGESVDMSIKGMYTLMARCEELDRSMQPIHTLAAQIRDIKRTLDALEAICK